MEWPRDIDLGVAGASARREGKRRQANRERRTREKHPRIGGALLLLRDIPSHERVWGIGAEGEEATAAYLAKKCPDATVLHDRRVPGKKSNIDHIAVVPSGVYVIDSKRYKNKRVRVANPLLGSSKLMVDGSDCTKLADGLVAQVELVTTLLADSTVPVHGTFCFVDADLPLVGGLSLRGLHIHGPRGLAKRLKREGPLSTARVHAIARSLATALPRA